jgi:hypothetical protein
MATPNVPPIGLGWLLMPFGTTTLLSAPIRQDLFAPAGMPPQAFNGYSRQLLVSYHGGSFGRATYRCAGGRMTRSEQAGSV